MTTARQRVEEMADYCNTEVFLSVLGGKWKLLILLYLLPGPQRFGELRRSCSTITHRMLTRQLRELEYDGLIQRRSYPEVPPRVEYSLTPTGRSLEPLIRQLDAWGEQYRGKLHQQAAQEES